MAAHRSSVEISRHYAGMLDQLAARSVSQARTAWTKLDPADLDASYEPIRQVLAITIRGAQREAVRMAAGFYTAYLSSELGHDPRAAAVAMDPYVGVTFRGKDLDSALRAPVIKAKLATREGQPDPLGRGLRALTSSIDLNVKHAARQSLSDSMQNDGRVIGWRRVTRGTCGACLALADNTILAPGTPLSVHPNCSCVASPVLRGVPDNAYLPPTGRAVISGMSQVVADQILGPAIAGALRDGLVSVDQLVQEAGGFIRPTPAQDLGIAVGTAAAAEEAKA
jgi:hypothetical protein